MTPSAGATETPLADYALATFEGHRVYRRGTGSAVLVLHEIPGLHPGVIAFANRLAMRYSVYLPSLFGRDGAPLRSGAAGWLQIGSALAAACVSCQFAVLLDRTSPAVSWLRRLAQQAHDECGGPGVGVVGMCITGGFALAMAVDPTIVAPVMSQPSLPAALPLRERTLGISSRDLERIEQRATADGLGVLGLRFSGDRLCPTARFQRLHDELGLRFEGIQINSSPGNPANIRERAHAVLTVDFVDQAGHPTRKALDRVLSFLEERLT
jgi:dienelactone hydrolase